jgi:hemerythrin-like metal-binding protein
MDAQHKNLIELINALGPSAGSGAASAGVAGMFAYAATHFQNEEALLLQCGYSELAAQQSEHASFLLKAAEFSKQNLSDLELCSQIKAFLLSWILHHILESDMKYKRCIPERLGR